MIIQVYEIQTLKEAQRCVDLGIDHIGSVLINPDNIPKELLKVREYVISSGNSWSLIPLIRDKELLLKSVKFFKPSIVHLCDDITKNREGSKLLQLRLKESLADIKIMRTLPVPVGYGNMDFIEELLSDFEESSDFFLLDTWVDEAPVQNYIGITGRTCNWDIAKQIIEASKKPCILAGGLSPENVYNAITYVRPYGVDTCTQTNRRDSKGNVIRFQKDFVKLEKFVKEARRGFRDNELH